MKGGSLIELLIALALALVLAGLAAHAVTEGADALAWQPVSGELSSRADALAQLLTADLEAAGAGLRLRPPAIPAAVEPTRLRSWLPPILPRVLAVDGGDPDDTAATDRLSILTIADAAPQALVRRVPPRWGFMPAPTCPALVDGCGFGNGLPVVWLEPRDGFQLGTADAVDASGLDVTGVVTPSTDAVVAGVEIVSYRFDAVRGELLRGRAAGRGLAVAAQVAAFAVELWGAPDPPPGPSWTPGVESCRTLADGSPRLPVLGGPGAPAVRLDAALLTDGPWCGVAPFRFDADLLRVRRVRLRLRLRPDPGDAAAVSLARPARHVQSMDVTLDVAPPALRGPW